MDFGVSELFALIFILFYLFLFFQVMKDLYLSMKNK